MCSGASHISGGSCGCVLALLDDGVTTVDEEVPVEPNINTIH